LSLPDGIPAWIGRQARSLRVLFGTPLQADRRATVVSGVLLLVAGGAVPVVALANKLLIDGAQRQLPAPILAAVVLTTVASAFLFGLAIQAVMIGIALDEKTVHVVDQRTGADVASIPTLEVHEVPALADRLALLRQDRWLLGQPWQLFLNSGQQVVGAVSSVVLLIHIHPLLAVVGLAGLPWLLFSSLGERSRQRALEATAEKTRQAAHLYELVTTPGPAKEVRIFGLGPELVRQHRRLMGEVIAGQRRATWLAALTGAGGGLLGTAAYLWAIYFVVGLARQGRATAGDVILTVNLAEGTLFAAIMLAASITSFVRAMAVAGRFVWLEDYARSRPAPASTAAVPSTLRQGLTLRDVGFTYEGAAEPTLSGVTLDLPTGSVVALVGENGAGKTTLVKLLCGLYRPTAGTILVDGIPLSDLDPARWRERTAAGFQDFVRFELTAADAVTIGDLPRLGELPAAERALDRASAAELALTLDDGLTTRLGTASWDGTDLSGGQWQKVAIARAMMRESPLLLVLDEPTASLDAATEHALFERYAAGVRRVAAKAGAVTLLVSHRFSTVRMADLIVVLRSGRVEEAGGHDELVRAGGLYAELYELQARAYR
jgi:ATP-binding cassette subfamily B protein